MTHEDQDSGLDQTGMEALADYFQSTSLADMESTEVSVEPARYPMVSRSIRMEQPVMADIRKVAKRLGVPVTQLMRQWIRQGLEQAKAEEAGSASLTPRGTSRSTSRDLTGVGVTANYSAFSVRGRSYSERLTRYRGDGESESVAGRLIERKVVQERAMRGSQRVTKRERSS